MNRIGLLRRPPGLAKWAKRGAGAVAISYGVYLVGVNAVLGHSIDLPEDVAVTYASAWSWYPGQLQASGLRIVGTDSHVEWQLDIERVHLHVSLFALLQRRFQASGVHGSGVAMRMRRKLDSAAATPAALAALPPIAGVSAPPIKPAVEPPPISDEDYRLWSVQIDDAEATLVREVWFDAYHFTGEARVVGGFTLRPVRMATVSPTSVDVTRGELAIFGDAALDALSGHLDVTVAPFDPREVVGSSVVRTLTTTARGEGHVVDLAFVKHYMSDPSAFALSGGAGPMLVQVRVVGGVLAAPSAVSVDSERVVVEGDGHRAEAATHLALVVDAAAVPAEARISLELARFGVWHGPAPDPIVHAARVVAHARSAELDLVRPFGDGSASLEWPDLVFPDLRRLDGYFGKGSTPFRGGVAHAHGALRASLATRQAKGNLTLAADALVVHAGTVDVHGSVAAEVTLVGLDLDSGRADLSGSRVDARNVVLSSTPTQSPWWGNVQLANTHLALAAPALLRTKVAFEAKDGRPVLTQAMPAGLANLIGLEGLHGGCALACALAAGASRVDLTGLHVLGQGGEVRAEFHQRGAWNHGIALVHAGLLTVGAELTNGSTSLRLLGAEEWYRSAAAGSSGAGAGGAAGAAVAGKKQSAL